MNLQNAARFLEIAKEAERKEAEHQATLAKHAGATARNRPTETQSCSAREMQHATKREAVAKMVDIISTFAAAILQSPADYPAHMINYAHGLIAESTDYANKERGAVAWVSP